MNQAQDPSTKIRQVRDLIKVIGEAIDPNMTWHQGLVFLAVAAAEGEEEGTDMRQLALYAGLTSTTISRDIAALGEWHRMQRPGLGLLDTEIDYTDRRRRPVRLTAEGRKIAKKIAKASDVLRI